MLLQTLNALFLRGLPGSQELNQQLANHFTEKVEHFMNTSQHVLGHIGCLRHAFTACIQESTSFIMAARPIAALPAAGRSPATRRCIKSLKPETLKSALVKARKPVAPCGFALLKDSVTCFTSMYH